VFAGGGFGASLRYLLEKWWAPPTPPEFPWVTLVVNLSGAFLLAFVTVLATTALRGKRWLGPLIGTGLLGGFTTWSTFVVENNQLLGARELAVSIGYMAASLFGGLCTALAGRSLAFAYDDMRRTGHD
jgi:CrcB protein